MPSSLPAGGNKVLSLIGDIALRCLGWKIQGQLPDCPKVVVAVAPHTSNWDFVIGVAALFSLRIKIKFLAKHSLFVPGFRSILHWLGGIPVNRNAAHGLVEQVGVEFKNRDKMILALAPEGTRSPIFPWKTGFLVIAKSVGVPVVMIGFDYKLRKIIIQPPMSITEDIPEHMLQVYAFFADVHAKYPDKCLTGPC